MAKQNEQSDSGDETLIHSWQDNLTVIKFGGAAMVEPDIKESVLDDIAVIARDGHPVVLVHGGGPAISRAMKDAGLEPEFIEGQRKTTAEGMRIVERVLVGDVNRDLVWQLRAKGVHAYGLSGRSGLKGQFIFARKHVRYVERDGRRVPIDLGFVGEAEKIDIETADILLKMHGTPVVAPIGVDAEGNSYNINADILAGGIAGSLKAKQLIYMTDVDGIRRDPADAESVIDRLGASEARALIGDVVQGGMIPKVESCLTALEAGVTLGRIVSGDRPGALVDAVTGNNKSGTVITN